MAGPIEHTIHFKCPDCGQTGIGVQPKGSSAHNISEGFHVETRDGEQVIICKCGTVAFPPASSN